MLGLVLCGTRWNVGFFRISSVGQMFEVGKRMIKWQTFKVGFRTIDDERLKLDFERSKTSWAQLISLPQLILFVLKLL
jgi:hypothetical protein